MVGDPSRRILRQIDVYFDDLDDLSNLVFRWKYDSYIDFCKKFQGSVCRNHRMEFNDHPKFFIRFGSTNKNKSFKGSVSQEEADFILNNPNIHDELTRRIVALSKKQDP